MICKKYQMSFICCLFVLLQFLTSFLKKSPRGWGPVLYPLPMCIYGPSYLKQLQSQNQKLKSPPFPPLSN